MTQDNKAKMPLHSTEPLNLPTMQSGPSRRKTTSLSTVRSAEFPKIKSELKASKSSPEFSSALLNSLKYEQSAEKLDLGLTSHHGTHHHSRQPQGERLPAISKKCGWAAVPGKVALDPSPNRSIPTPRSRVRLSRTVSAGNLESTLPNVRPRTALGGTRAEKKQEFNKFLESVNREEQENDINEMKAKHLLFWLNDQGNL